MLLIPPVALKLAQHGLPVRALLPAPARVRGQGAAAPADALPRRARCSSPRRSGSSRPGSRCSPSAAAPGSCSACTRRASSSGSARWASTCSCTLGASRALLRSERTDPRRRCCARALVGAAVRRRRRARGGDVPARGTLAPLVRRAAVVVALVLVAAGVAVQLATRGGRNRAAAGRQAPAPTVRHAATRHPTARARSVRHVRQTRRHEPRPPAGRARPRARVPPDRRPEREQAADRLARRSASSGSSRGPATCVRASPSTTPTTRSSRPASAGSSRTRSSTTRSPRSTCARTGSSGATARPGVAGSAAGELSNPDDAYVWRNRHDHGRRHQELPGAAPRPGRPDRGRDRRRGRLRARPAPLALLAERRDAAAGRRHARHRDRRLGRPPRRARTARLLRSDADDLPVRRAAAPGRQRARRRLQHARPGRRDHPAGTDRLDVRADVRPRGARPAVARRPLAERHDRDHRRLAPPDRRRRPADEADRLAVRPLGVASARGRLPLEAGRARPAARGDGAAAAATPASPLAVATIGRLPAPASRLAAAALPGGRILVAGGLVGGSSSRPGAARPARPAPPDAGRSRRRPTTPRSRWSGRAAYLFGGGEAVSTDAVVRIDPRTGAAPPRRHRSASRSPISAPSTRRPRLPRRRLHRHDRSRPRCCASGPGARRPSSRAFRPGLRYAGVGGSRTADLRRRRRDRRRARATRCSRSTRDRHAFATVATLPEPVAHAPLVALGGVALPRRRHGRRRRSARRDPADRPASGAVALAGRLPEPLADAAAVAAGRRVIVLGGAGVLAFRPRR